MLTTLLSLAHATPPAPTDLTGTWALEMRAVSSSRVAILGEVDSVARTAVLVQLEPSGDGWIQHHRPCGSAIDGSMLVKTRIPDAYFDRVQPKVLYPRIESSPDGVDFAVDIQRFTGGWDPTQCDDVPSDADSPCVRDWDQDGKPGVTIEVKAPFFSWTQVYVAQLTHPHLDGRALDADHIEGRLWLSELDNRVLGASNSLFHTQPKTRSRNDLSTFTMVRIPQESTCTDVLQRLDI